MLSFGLVQAGRVGTIALAIAVLACDHSAIAALVATARTTTGEMRLTNTGTSAFELVGYTVSQATPQLLPYNWDRIAGRHDASPTGDGTLDPDGTWIILQPGGGVLPMFADELAEAALTDTSATLQPGQSLYLGSIWNPNSPKTLSVEIAQEGQLPLNITPSYVGAGDYNEDGNVNATDYEVWKASFGDWGFGLMADGNRDLVVDLEDYSIWRDHLRYTVAAASAAPFTLLTSAVIPEPSSAALASLALLAVVAARRVRYSA